MPTNLALTGTASAGNTYGADVPAQAIDGNVATKWQGAATNTWWKIDLGAAKNFDKFSICTAAVSYSMTIAGSLNDVDWATIVLAPYASRTALTDIVLAAAVTYRYVRLTYTDGANWSSLYELQIWEAMPPAPGRYLGVRGRDRIGAGGGRSPRRTSLIDISRRATALGGTLSDTGGSVIHTFTADGALTVITSGVVDVLVVAGGGGGGCFRGGGGGGGWRYLRAGEATSTRHLQDCCRRWRRRVKYRCRPGGRWRRFCLCRPDSQRRWRWRNTN